MSIEGPYSVLLEKEKRYCWCTCGKSAQDPFCDGTHKGLGIGVKSLTFSVEEETQAQLCSCKKTKTPPYCDGSHNPQCVPLNDLHEEKGARMVPFAGYKMPLQYPTGILAEHHHVRTACGIFDVSHMGTVFIRGDNVGEALNKLIPADLATLPFHKVRYGLLLSDTGGIVDDLLITRWKDCYQLVLNAGCKETDLAYLKRNLPELTFETAFDNAILAVQGPKAHTVIAALCAEAATLPFMSAGKFILNGADVIISRTGYTGEDGFEMIIPPTIAHAVANSLLAQEGVALIGLGARDSLRLEAGLCLYGHELNLETSPIEAGLTWAIGKESRAKDGFKGDERILREIKEGASKRRIGLILKERAIAREGAKVYDGEGCEIGVVTSGVHSPTLNQPIAMAFVEKTADLSHVQVMVREQLRAAEVVKLPFVATKYYKG